VKWLVLCALYLRVARRLVVLYTTQTASKALRLEVDRLSAQLAEVMLVLQRNAAASAAAAAAPDCAATAQLPMPELPVPPAAVAEPVVVEPQEHLQPPLNTVPLFYEPEPLTTPPHHVSAYFDYHTITAIAFVDG
jgi:hypothetical protein